MVRFKTVSSLLFTIAAILVCCVFMLHFWAPPYDTSDNGTHRLNQGFGYGIHFIPRMWAPRKMTTVFIPAEPYRQITEPLRKCRENLISLEQYRSRSVVRAVIFRFPSKQADYYFVQFRWFYRSWIESEMFTLDRWRTDLIVLIDDKFPKKIQQYLEHLDCHEENLRTARRQISRCILVIHKSFSQRTSAERQYYIEKYPMLSQINEIDDNLNRLFAIYDFINTFTKKHLNMYDFLMMTTMNTFLTTQFGKYIPIKCSFLLGKAPDYATLYGKVEQIIEFVHVLFTTLKESDGTQKNPLIDFNGAIESLKNKFLFIENQVDIPCDSTMTTYRTSIYHLKCYAHSTSLFSEKMFREKSYDGFEKQPFNIYIAREYAALMALQSKAMSLDDLHSLAVNITRREVYT